MLDYSMFIFFTVVLGLPISLCIVLQKKRKLLWQPDVVFGNTAVHEKMWLMNTATSDEVTDAPPMKELNPDEFRVCGKFFDLQITFIRDNCTILGF